MSKQNKTVEEKEPNIEKWLLHKGLHNSVISHIRKPEYIYVSDAIKDYTSGLSSEVQQLREALREILPLAERIAIRSCEFESITKAKQLLKEE